MRMADTVPPAALSPPDWLVRLWADTQQAPLRPRVPLRCAAGVIGSVEPDFLRPFADLRQPGGAPVLREDPTGAWHVAGDEAGDEAADVTAGLALLAAAMRTLGLAGAWRDEALAVCNEQGLRVGQVERAAVRPLGIATQAVHLVGLTASGEVWVQQRALTKANDPGLWDTLMGGMVAAVDTLDTALARETWEEAGLQMAQLGGLRQGGCIETCRPSTDGGGAGYVLEQITWYQAVLPDGLQPENQDGEVAQFARLAQGEVLARIQRGEFTQEAALILAECLLYHFRTSATFHFPRQAP